MDEEMKFKEKIEIIRQTNHILPRLKHKKCKSKCKNKDKNKRKNKCKNEGEWTIIGIEMSIWLWISDDNAYF